MFFEPFLPASANLKGYFQTIRKRDFAEILENFLAAGHLVF